MKTKVIITEEQFTAILKSKLQENKVNELMNLGVNTNGGKPMGAVELDKSQANNTNQIQKFTSKGIDVKLVGETEIDEALGEEQAVNLRHQFEGKNLNIYSSRDKVTLREVLKYISAMKDQPIIETSFNEGAVNLHIKEPKSGRYKHLGSFSKDALNRYRAISDKETVQGIQSEVLNENLAE